MPGMGKLFQTPRNVAWLSVAAAVTTMALKIAAWLLTGSVGLLSDAAESMVNLTAASLALLALTVAMRPADERHAYGHDKAEYFSSGAEGVLILVAAAGIVYAAVSRMFDPQPLRELGPGLAVAVVASAVNLLVAKIMLRMANHFDSITLEADAKHLMTDVWTSVGVVGGLAVVWAAPSWRILDPIMAVAVAAHIVISGVELLKRSYQGLMDHALPPEELAAIHECICAKAGDDAVYHGLRTRKSGPRRFIDFHLLVPGRMSVQQSHDLTQAIEQAIGERLNRSQVTIHVEPIEDGGSWDGEHVGGVASDARSCEPEDNKA
ncbi:cation diffusion facilitator family transporter [Desulfocurvibacter africanus PCS]|uniref:Cation diffusion facilitator family transporter n=1 Tax=Desulfocurvibacter africanus PCS TaxID=1262666 RepID=M5PZL2_DESAF|nr:cation diffusion facilitator family transporter [Desulfocurvibacter africanus]EMG35951.1 cation diffusion facilitator family transporter [Desulfocurvibacter africanus PCS]